MSRFKFLLIAIILLFMVSTGLAQVPKLINYQGLLLDTNKKPVSDGQYKLTFRIYEKSNYNLLWTEPHAAVALTAGLFNVILGSVNSLDLEFDRPYLLGIQVGTDPELSPLMELTSVAYSLNADKVKGTGNVFPSNGNVGVGTTNPGFKLEVTDIIGITGTGNEGGQLSLLDGDGKGGWEIDNFGSPGDEALRVFRGRGYDDVYHVLVVKPSGNVGIGTVPTEKLQVDGVIQSLSGGFKFPDGSIQTKAFMPGTTADNLGDHIATQNIQLNGHWLAGDADNEGIYVNDLGNVGIGTEHPKHTLHVKGWFQLQGSDFLMVDSTRGNGGRALVHWGSGNKTDDQLILNFGGDFEEGVKIDGAKVNVDGKLGIGINNPVEKLEVAGMIKSSVGGFKFPDGTVQSTAAPSNGGLALPFADTVIVNTQPAFAVYNDGLDHAIKGSISFNGINPLTGNPAHKAGVYGEATNTDFNALNYGGYFISYGGKGRGVYGGSTGDNGYGVYGEAVGNAGYGVYGFSRQRDGAGVFGESKEGNAVYGENTGTGIAGYFAIKNNSNTNPALRAHTNGSGEAIYANTYGTGNAGYFAINNSNSSKYAIEAVTNGYGGGAVSGFASNISSVTSCGGYFKSLASLGIGVYGEASGNLAKGVSGKATGENGIGVEGIAANSGFVRNFGGYFSAKGSIGVGIYAEGGTGGYGAIFKGNVQIQNAKTGAVVIELGEGLDYAEGFEAVENSTIEAGTVVVIDVENPGKLTISTEPYDCKVAGIVAGANGLCSGMRLASGKFDIDVALAGRVYCKVDASYGEVRPGDLLTSSPTPGYAMVVKDYLKAQGAILGKAMTALAEGKKGEILVLVTLQ